MYTYMHDITGSDQAILAVISAPILYIYAVGGIRIQRLSGYGLRIHHWFTEIFREMIG